MKAQIPWLRVFVEGVVIVGSILLALGLDAWWTNRQERLLEVALLTQLESDLARAEEQLAAQIKQTEGGANAALNLLRASSGESEAMSDSVASWISRVGWYSDPVPTIATAQSIASSGDLYVVRGDALRASIVALLDEIRQLDVRVLPYERLLDAHMRALDRLIDPLARGEPLAVGVLDGGLDAYVESGFQREVSIDLAEAIHVEGFSLVAYDIFWVHENLRWLQARMLDATQGLRAEVQEELTG